VRGLEFLPKVKIDSDRPKKDGKFDLGLRQVADVVWPDDSQMRRFVLVLLPANDLSTRRFSMSEVARTRNKSRE
jgi:hypothetical protein